MVSFAGTRSLGKRSVHRLLDKTAFELQDYLNELDIG